MIENKIDIDCFISQPIISKNCVAVGKDKIFSASLFLDGFHEWKIGED